jgi:predicted amidohydrolase YtcJ
VLAVFFAEMPTLLCHSDHGGDAAYSGGDILVAVQCIGVGDALKSLTLWGAYQHYEEAKRGTIEVGKLADFVILDRNPHKVAKLDLSELKVLETIKSGRTIFTAK